MSFIKTSFFSLILTGFALLLIFAYFRSNANFTLSKTEQKSIIVTSKTLDSKQTGLRVYKPEKCYGVYTLFTHMPLHIRGTVETTPVYLIDMNANIVHQWMVDNWTFHAQLKPDGHLFYITEADPIELFKKQKLNNPEVQGHGLWEVDAKSNPVWYYPAFIEHGFQIMDDGNILIEDKEPINEPRKISDKGILKGPRVSPCIEIISREEKTIWRWRGEEHVGELKYLLGIQFDLIDDWAHNNACVMIGDNPLAKRDSRFKKGNIIFSYSYLNAIGIIDYKSGKIVWAWGPGYLEGQHSPSMLCNGNLLVFDNGSRRGWSRIIELNPLTKKIVWEYRSEPKEDFFSKELSNTMRLPNGNTLICEASKNRIFEITRGGEIVWDFISTLNKTTGGEGIFHAYRYSHEYVKPLLQIIEENNKQDK